MKRVYWKALIMTFITGLGILAENTSVLAQDSTSELTRDFWQKVISTNTEDGKKSLSFKVSQGLLDRFRKDFEKSSAINSEDGYLLFANRNTGVIDVASSHGLVGRGRSVSFAPGIIEHAKKIAEENNYLLIGTYHSHPPSSYSEPSDDDYYFMKKLALPVVLLGHGKSIESFGIKAFVPRMRSADKKEPWESVLPPIDELEHLGIYEEDEALPTPEERAEMGTNWIQFFTTEVNAQELPFRDAVDFKGYEYEKVYEGKLSDKSAQAFAKLGQQVMDSFKSENLSLDKAEKRWEVRTTKNGTLELSVFIDTNTEENQILSLSVESGKMIPEFRKHKYHELPLVSASIGINGAGYNIYNDEHEKAVFEFLEQSLIQDLPKELQSDILRLRKIEEAYEKAYDEHHRKSDPYSYRRWDCPDDPISELLNSVEKKSKKN